MLYIQWTNEGEKYYKHDILCNVKKQNPAVFHGN